MERPCYHAATFKFPLDHPDQTSRACDKHRTEEMVRVEYPPYVGLSQVIERFDSLNVSGAGAADRQPPPERPLPVGIQLKVFQSLNDEQWKRIEENHKETWRKQYLDSIVQSRELPPILGTPPASLQAHIIMTGINNLSTELRQRVAKEGIQTLPPALKAQVARNGMETLCNHKCCDLQVREFVEAYLDSRFQILRDQVQFCHTNGFHVIALVAVSEGNIIQSHKIIVPIVDALIANTDPANPLVTFTDRSVQDQIRKDLQTDLCYFTMSQSTNPRLAENDFRALEAVMEIGVQVRCILVG